MKPPAGRAAQSTRARGRAAEAAAAVFLEREGYAVVARNHATRRGEVDLVCRDGATLCFVEVRSRSRLDFGSPAASVTVAKARRVVAAATDWAVRHGGLEQDMRFDVVAVDLSGNTARFELIRGAFDADGKPM
ncbi:MAG TPA: YraN family protein [Anaeromyxobacteraceae bacterium]